MYLRYTNLKVHRDIILRGYQVKLDLLFWEVEFINELFKSKIKKKKTRMKAEGDFSKTWPPHLSLVAPFSATPISLTLPLKLKPKTPKP